MKRLLQSRVVLLALVLVVLVEVIVYGSAIVTKPTYVVGACSQDDGRKPDGSYDESILDRDGCPPIPDTDFPANHDQAWYKHDPARKVK